MTLRGPLALLVAALLGVVAGLAYAPVAEFPFVQYDDDIRLLSNPPVRQGLSAGGLYWAFTAMWDANWSPLTWLSHMLDFTLFAGDAGGHHVTNAILHALNVALLFLMLRAATGDAPRAACVALLLALHPIHVETVAWVSERKGVLSATFGFAALWCYAADPPDRPPRFRTLSLALFALGLMAKPMLVCLPFLLPLVDRLRRNPPPNAKLAEQLLRLWPWLGMSAVSGAITLLAQSQGDALQSASDLPLLSRLSNALVASVAYLWKLLWPAQLAPFYPHPGLPGGTPLSPLQVIGAAAFWIAATALAWRSGHRVLQVGLAWYAIALLPVLGLVQVGSQGMADRYAYLPAVGIYLALVWCVADAVQPRGRRAVLAATAVGVAALLALGVAGQRQIRVWRSSESLFRHATRVTEANYSMHYHLAGALANRGQIEAAIEQYRRAVAIHPGLLVAQYDLANTLVDELRYEEALVHYRAAVEAAPDFQPARDTLGRLLIRQGDLEGALAHYREEAQRQPASLAIRVTLAQLLLRIGDLAAAADAFDEAARLPGSGERWRQEARALRARIAAGADAP